MININETCGVCGHYVHIDESRRTRPGASLRLCICAVPFEHLGGLPGGKRDGGCRLGSYIKVTASDPHRVQQMLKWKEYFTAMAKVADDMAKQMQEDDRERALKRQREEIDENDRPAQRRRWSPSSISPLVARTVPIEEVIARRVATAEARGECIMVE
jgi:hypothetical protein